MKKITFLFAVLFASIMSWGETVTITNGTNATGCTVNEVTGVKLGTSKKGGDCSITVPAGSTKLTLYAAAWKGGSGLSLEITGASANPSSLSLTEDDGVSGNSPFTLTGNAESFKFEIALTNITAATALNFSASSRCVIWGADAEVSSSSDVVLTPTITPNGENFVTSQEVTITCATAGATITYTTDDWSTSNTYTAAFTVTETTTVKAKATKSGLDDSSEASATFTKVTPLTTMDAIFAKATEVGNTETDAYVTFNNWVVTGVKNSNAYVTDGTKGFIAYKSGHGFKVGDILSGTAQCKLKLYNGAAEFTTLAANTEDLTVTEGGTITPQVANIADLSGVNTGAPITVENVTYDGTNLVDASGNTIKPFNTLYSCSFTNGKKYNVTGVYLQFNDTKEILPRSEDDIYEIPATKYAINIDVLTNGTIVASEDEAAAGVEITLTITPATHYQLKANSLVVMGETTGDGVSVASNKFDMPAENVLVSAEFEEKAKYHVMYYSLDKSSTIGSEDVYNGETLASIPVPTVPTGWTFAGWTTSNTFTTGTTAPTYFNTTSAITEDVSLYAVFSKSEGGSGSAWTKVTSEPADWSGEYLLVYEVSETEGLAWTGVDGGQCHADVTISDGAISTKPDDAKSISIAAMTGGYSIMVNGGANDGQYIGKSTYANGMDFSANGLVNTISYGSNSVVITGEGGCTMRYNSTSGDSNERFRYYKTGQKAVQLYKYTTASSTTYTINDPAKKGAVRLMTADGSAEAGWVNFGAIKVDNADETLYTDSKTYQLELTNIADYSCDLAESSTYFEVSEAAGIVTVTYKNIPIASAETYTAELEVYAEDLNGDEVDVFFHIVLEVNASGSFIGTSVDNTNAAEVSVKKVIRDGQLYIIREGVTYNALGAVVE